LVHNQQKATGEEAKRLRRQVGEYLRALRDTTGKTQRELADELGLAYYTFISQLESGHGRVPPHLYVHYARALDVDPHEFAKVMLRHYDPFTYQALFESKEVAYNELKGDRELPKKTARPRASNKTED
jgi:transcriptional regulator with XRE-family HTH domain